MILKRRVPVVLQLTSGECGAACLAMVVSYHGKKTRLADCRPLLPIGRDGATARMLIGAGRRLGLDGSALSVDAEAFESLPLPLIAHWGFSHFVVVECRSRKSIGIVDPARGRTELTREAFDNAFTGVVIVFKPSAGFIASRGRRQPRWGRYLSDLRPLKGRVALVLGCSFVLQLVGLALPLMTAFVIDHVLPTNDEALLPLLVFAALMLILNQLAIANLRERLLLSLRADLNRRVTTGFVEHLLALPLGFFDRRGSGDLLSRLASNTVVRETLSTPLISAVLDGTFAMVYLAILLSQNLTFGLIVLMLGAIQATVVLAMTNTLNIRFHHELSVRAESYDYLVQTFAGIATLKGSGGERCALDKWSPLLGREISATADVDRIHAVIGTATSAVRVLSPLALLLFGTYQVLQEELTLGVMLAFIALGLAFLAPISSLVSNMQEIQRAGAHVDRLSDVLEAPVEQRSNPQLRRHRLSGSLELRNVCFAYELGGPLVLDGISVSVAPGSKLAVVGRSGSGKSTLAKMLLGLYEPLSGDVLYDTVPLRDYDLRSLRSNFGVVLQEPALFAGTIRDNIAFHRPDASLERVIVAAKAAAIHDTIMAMPLRYETPVMQAGTGISGGQRQRIALAQALAREPALLVLDEATSHLDAVTERTIDRHLSGLACTRIVVAHRLSTIQDATQILVLENGAVVERGTHLELVLRRGEYWNLVRQQMVDDSSSNLPRSVQLESAATEVSALPPPQ